MIKIYIYELPEIEKINTFFESVPQEMDLFNFFNKTLKEKYLIVDKIEDSDIAFIPIDFTKLIYGKVKDNMWDKFFTLMKRKVNRGFIPTQQPPTFGVEDKIKYIRFFWDNFVKTKINKVVPHFILYSYVLFEISFDSIDNDIKILSYENNISFFNTLEIIKTNNIIIPYPINEINRINIFDKEYNLGFIGTLNSNDRPLLYETRNFLNFLKNKIPIHISNDYYNDLSKIKFLFVLRGDTQTRVSFYQCFALNIVPIIFKEEESLYGSLLVNDVNILDSCLIIPNKGNLSDFSYSNLVYDILKNEITDEKYINKIKDHQKIFNELNYFSDEVKPIDNVIRYLKNER
jgi:hypothetical protein